MHTSFICFIQTPKYMSTCKRFLYRERFLNPEHYIYNLLLLLTPIAKAFFGCSFPFTTYKMYVLKKEIMCKKFKIVTNQCRKQ